VQDDWTIEWDDSNEPNAEAPLGDLLLAQTLDNADAFMRTLAEIRALPDTGVNIGRSW